MADDELESGNTQLLKRIVALELILMTLWDMFKHAPRGGTDIDYPEGSRYIQISDTMANDVERSIDNLLDTNRVMPLDLRTNPDQDTAH